MSAKIAIVDRSTPAPTGDYLRPEEAAAMLNISRATLQDWVARSKIGVVRLNARTFRYPKSEVRRILDQNYTPAIAREGRHAV